VTGDRFRREREDLNIAREHERHTEDVRFLLVMSSVLVMALLVWAIG
jgi:hypothetical protein